MNKNDLGVSFTQMPLNRVSGERKNDEWLLSQLSNESCQIIPVWRSEFLFKQDQLISLQGNNKHKVLTKTFKSKNEGYGFVFLGLNVTTPIFAVDLSCLEDKELMELFSNDYEMLSLRASLSILAQDQASILGYANSLLHWNKSNRFCGYCGAPTQAQSGGHSIVCINENCKKEVFPRTDPVVIMLVEYQPEHGPAQCLLAEHTRSNSQCFSTLAGFVDPAETLEQAVIREVNEEVGVSVFDVEYAHSQPWPFPCSLMIGFYAKAHNKTICIDDEEINDAKWFTADEIRLFDNWGDEGDNFKLPRKQSIARLLIDSWLEKQVDSNDKGSI